MGIVLFPAPIPDFGGISPAAAGAATLLATYVRALSVEIAATLPVVSDACLVALGTVGDSGAGPLPADDPDLAALPAFSKASPLFWLGSMTLADAAARFRKTLVAPSDGTTLLVIRARGATGVFNVSA